MSSATPRFGIAALALALAAAITLGPALLAGTGHAQPKSRGEVSISQLAVDHDSFVVPAPANGKALETITVKAKR